MSPKLKTVLNNIWYPVITALLVAVITISINGYVEFKVTKATQNNKLELLDSNIRKNTKYIRVNQLNIHHNYEHWDTALVQNNRDHVNIQKDINGLRKDIQTLTFVVSKYNSDVRRDIQELKQLSVYGADIGYNSSNPEDSITYGRRSTVQ